MISPEQNKLRGLRVLVTRSAHQADETAVRLERLGAEAICLPLIEIAEPDSWDDFDNACGRLQAYDWIVFASANAVDAFFNRLKKLGGTLPTKTKIATIGPKTTTALEKHGLSATYQAPEFVAESFVQNFPADKGAKILWPKTNIGRTLIADQLTARGCNVDIVFCYQTKLPVDVEGTANRLISLLTERKLDVITLASSQTAKNMRAILDLVSPNAWKDLLGQTKILAIGPETARAAEQWLGRCDMRAAEYTVDGMIDVLLKAAQGVE